MNPQLSIPKTDLVAFCQAHGIRRLAVFGSALRADFGPESDIDVLVEFEPGRAPGLRFVSIAVERSPNYIRRREILDSAEVIYATR